MKKVYIIFALICVSLFITEINAENVSCTYLMKEGSCDDGTALETTHETGDSFTLEIYTEKIGDGKFTMGGYNGEYSNNEEGNAGLDGDQSAVNYYKAYGCPPYFGITQTGASEYTGMFIDEVTKSKAGNFTFCIFPLEKREYEEDFTATDDVFSCTLYSSQETVLNESTVVKIDYNNKTIKINEIAYYDDKTQAAFNNYVENFDFSQKEKCPVNDFKICLMPNTTVIYLSDFEETKGYACGTLDKLEKLIVGDTYCGKFKAYADEINKSNDYGLYVQTLTSLKNFCNSILQNENVDDYEFSCVNMCLNYTKYINKSITTETKCNVSHKLIVFIRNLLRWIKYIIPAAVIVLGILDFIKAIGAEKDDEMKKAQGRFIKRLIAAALIFLIPLIIEFVLGKMGFGYNDCGLF